MGARKMLLLLGCSVLCLGEIWLVGDDRAAEPARRGRSTAGARPAGSVVGDAARLARIRAAKMPPVTRPVMFNTPAADAILSALEVYPPDNPWNQVVSDWPVHPNSKNMIASIGVDKPLRYNPDMGFALVPPNQKRERLRLRQDCDISGFSPAVQAILKGLKKYGMFVADNGIEWAISVAPDERISVLHEELRKVKGSAVVMPPQ